jgi:cell wall-associated NlpC family hydrolase
MKKYNIPLLLLVLLSACNLFEVRKTGQGPVAVDMVALSDTALARVDTLLRTDSLQARRKPAADGTENKDTVLLPPTKEVNTGTVQPDALMRFAESQLGVPYKYASSNPKTGFDCSGFITYVFNHFGIAVPRSSIDFTNVGKTVTVEEARRGDIILFTGTDSTEKFIGHMGLVTENNGSELQFIHSSSGKAMGVTVTPLNEYYKKRFVRISRIFPQNDR